MTTFSDYLRNRLVHIDVSSEQLSDKNSMVDLVKRGLGFGPYGVRFKFESGIPLTERINFAGEVVGIATGDSNDEYPVLSGDMTRDAVDAALDRKPKFVIMDSEDVSSGSPRWTRLAYAISRQETRIIAIS